MGWTINKISDVLIEIRIEYDRLKGWDQWFMLSADTHLDNPKCNHELKRSHLAECQERGAFLIEVGDFIDAMQGKEDKRSSKRDLMEQMKKGSYLNDLVDYSSEFLKPYKGCLAVITEGNHESAIKNRLEYNLLDGLVRDLQREGSPVIAGGYRGWIRFNFVRSGKKGERSKHSDFSFLAYYHHGSGGGGPVTKGIIQTNRRATYLPEADMIFSGHTHEHWIFPMTRVKLSKTGEEYPHTQYHVQLPTYKEEYMNEKGGWHHETGKPPKPVGGVWGRFYYNHKTDKINVQFMETDKC